MQTDNKKRTFLETFKEFWLEKEPGLKTDINPAGFSYLTLTRKTYPQHIKLVVGSTYKEFYYDICLGWADKYRYDSDTIPILTNIHKDKLMNKELFETIYKFIKKEEKQFNKLNKKLQRINSVNNNRSF